MLYAFQNNGDGTGKLLEATTDMPGNRHAIFRSNVASNSGVAEEDILLWSGPAIAGKVVAAIVGGAVASAQADPAWTPPAPPPDPLAELRQIVDRNILASEHDKRWLAQKEAVKRLGIAWIKAHPACAQAEAEAALTGLLAAELPGEPLVISPSGVIASYAQAAQARGHIPSSTFEALRDLIAAATQDQLAQLLAKL